MPNPHEKISGIYFPKPLLNALRNNQLVVFAGAGVSIPQPAGLPTFRQLAGKIAFGSGETREKDEPDDRFLGRLKHKGQKVHLRAVTVLRENDPKPSCLHHDLTALYRDPDHLRIVTTNFDTLFEEAAKERFGTLPAVSRAPALPLGRDFNGIVHVHGSIDSHKDMVLTDADFGRAYLTEGWARNFLLDLFRACTVLFVGYGHNDTVMNYLARALPVDETQPRFVLTDEAERNQWDILGMKPVIFPKPDENDYSGLYKGVSGLSERATRGILDWQSDITRIATNPPSLDEEEMDLVEDGLSNTAHTRFFTEAASHIGWVQWLDENRHLDSLFGGRLPPSLGEPARTLGWWLARTFVKEHPDEVFRLIAKHGMDPHPEFWDTLGRAVVSKEDTPWEAETLARWVSLLLTTAPPQPDSSLLLWLGGRCMEAGLTDSLLDVFRKMSAVNISVQERLTFQEDAGPSTTAEVVQVHGHSQLNELWEKRLKPNLNDVAEPLLDQLVHSFTFRHRTLCAWQAAGRNWGPTNFFGRRAIEPHEHDSHPQSLDVLIDSARDSLEHLAARQPEIAATWCDQLIRSDIPILRRLAVHALNLRSDLTPSTKIDWVIDKIGLHDRPARHELFRVMRAIYPDATPERRRAIIEEISKFDLPGRDEEDIARTITYQHFTWFSWLSQSGPDCRLVHKCVEDILEQYPEFKPPTWADLTHSSSSRSVRHQSPWNVDQLLSKPAKEWADKLLALQDPHDRTSLAHAVEEAATRDFPWGIELADTLAQLENWETDLWPPLMRSWARQRREEEEDKVLDRLSYGELQKTHAMTVAATLMTLVKEGHLPHSSGLLSKANQVAIKAWGKISEDEPILPMEDWDSRARKHSAGILAKFWMHSIFSWYNQQDPRPAGISEEYLGFMHEIIEEETTSGRLGQSAIARQFGFLTAVDQEWAVEHLVPLFDSEIKDNRQAVWEGLLPGGINPRVAEILEASFLRALSDMDELFPKGTKSRESFIDQITKLLTYFVDQPLDPWIPMFFVKAEVDDRRRFAWNIADILRHMETGPQRDLWDRWLRKYWENRLEGTPTPLNTSEAGAMLNWLLHLHDLFPEAVDLAIKMPNLRTEYGPIIRPFFNKCTAKSHPEATGKLLIYLSDQELARAAWHDGKEFIESLLECDLPKDLEEKLKEIPAKLGL